MDDFLKEVKVGLEVHLSKIGSSLESLEDALANSHTPEGAIKLAGITESLIGTGVNGLSNLLAKAPEAALASALLVGTTGGAALYGADKYINNQDKQFDNKQNEIERLKALTSRIKNEHGLQ